MVSLNFLPSSVKTLGILLMLLVPGVLFAQTSITSNDGGTSTAGNLYEAVTFINGTTSGGNVTLAISGSNSVTLGQAIPDVSQSVTFLGTAGTDQALNILAGTETEGAVTFGANLTLGTGVTLDLLNDGLGGPSNLDASVTMESFSMGVSSTLGVTAATGVTNSILAGGNAGNSDIAAGSMTFISTESHLDVVGGQGGMGGNSLSGGIGGGASVTVGSLMLSGTSNNIGVTGGTGGTGGAGGAGGGGGTGGVGGSASVTAGSLVFAGTNNRLDVTGGTGGIGGLGGGGGAGSNASMMVGSLIFSGSQDSLNASGGTGEMNSVGGGVSINAVSVTLSGVQNSLNLLGGQSGNGNGGSAMFNAVNVNLSGNQDSLNVIGANTGLYNGGLLGGNAFVSIGSMTMAAGTTFQAVAGQADNSSTPGSTLVTIGSLNGSGSVSLWGSTAILQVDSGDFLGVIAGNESLDVSGPGSLVLDGINTYTGPTTIAGGMLAVGAESGTAAQIAGDAVVSSGATLAGFGQVQGVVTNNGLVLPGNGNAGILTVGNYTQSAEATLAIGVSPTQASSLSVLGTATLAGALTVTATGNFGIKYTYDLLTAGVPLSGKFTNYGFGLPASILSTLTYSSNDVVLTLTRSNPNFSTWAQTANEQAVAQVLNAAVSNASGDLLNKMNILYTQSSGQGEILEQLGGVIYTALPHLALESAQFEQGLLMDRLSGIGLGDSLGPQAWAWNPGPYADAAQSDASSYLQPKDSKGYWLEQMDSFGSFSGNSEVSGFNQTNYGFLGGYETKGGNGFTTGFAVGYGHTNLNSQVADGTAGVDDWQGNLYGKYAFHSFKIAAVLGYGFNQYQVSRPIGTGIQADSSFGGNQVNAGVQLADHLQLKDLNPEVLAGMEYAFVETGAFRESNADSYDLSVPGEKAYSLRPYVGVGVSPKLEAGSVELSPVVKVTAARELLSQSAQQEITLAGAAQSPFTINGVTPDSTIIGAEAGLGVKLDKHFNLYAAYDGYFGGNEMLNTFSGGMDFGF